MSDRARCESLRRSCSSVAAPRVCEISQGGRVTTDHNDFFRSAFIVGRQSPGHSCWPLRQKKMQLTRSPSSKEETFTTGMETFRTARAPASAARILYFHTPMSIRELALITARTVWPPSLLRSNDVDHNKKLVF